MLDEADAGWPSAVMGEVRAPSDTLGIDEIRERMSGNLCRCAAYAGITEAVLEAQETLAGTGRRDAA